MQPFVEEGDGIIFFLQEAEFSRCASIGSRMCDGEDISSIEIIEILQILRKRLSKYIFYSSFSLLTFATKK